MILVVGLFLITFFAATVYAAVILIQAGGLLTVLAGLLLICSYFITGGLALIGAAVATARKKGETKE